MKRPSILVFGSTGLLGSSVCLHGEGECSIIIPSRSSYDFTLPSSIKDVIDACKPDIIINCAAMTNVDHCQVDPDRSNLVNYIAPFMIAKECANAGVRLVHISTDFVFSGNLLLPMSYHNGDATDFHPAGVYARHKKLAEELVQETLDSVLIIRLSWLFGGIRPTFPDWVVQKASFGDVSVPSDRYGSPSYVQDVARSVLELAIGDNFGVMHVVSGGTAPVSQVDYAKECLKAIGSDVTVSRTLQRDLVKNGIWNVARPINSSLLPDVKLRDWKEALSEYLKLKLSVQTMES